MRQRWPVLLLAFVVLPSAIAGRTSSGAAVLLAQAGPQSLTRSAPATPTAPETRREAWERRVRVVTIDIAALPDRATATKPTAGAQIVIGLLDGRSIQAVFERFDPNASGVTWVGSVPGVPSSRVTLAYGGGLLAASIVLPDASYTIRPVPLDPLNPASPTASPLHLLAEVDASAWPREADPIEIAFPQFALDQAADAVMADSADVVELLMVYTAAVEAWAGGPSGILNWINLAVSDTNSAFQNSGVFHRVQLLHAERVAYAEVSSFSTNLTNLRSGLGALSGVPALRDAYGADLVSMLVRPSAPDACGIAFLMTSVTNAFASNAFSVVDSQCVANATLSHEIGHNMGLRHDWYMDAGVTPFTYAHGYVNTAARFRTIMSYPDSCQSLGFSCVRLQAFSNPELFHLGVPMGIPGGTSVACPTGNANNLGCDADERRALNDTALTVANFRQATTLRPPSIVGHPASQSVPRGQQVTLAVSATGLGPFSYQWYRGQSPSTLNPINGATGPTYVFVPGSDGMWFERWFYWVRVSNQIGAASSLSATITLLTGPNEANRGVSGFVTGPGPMVPLVRATTGTKTNAPASSVIPGSALTKVAAIPDEPTAEPIDWAALCAAIDRSGVHDLLERAWLWRTSDFRLLTFDFTLRALAATCQNRR